VASALSQIIRKLSEKTTKGDHLWQLELKSEGAENASFGSRSLLQWRQIY